MLCTGVGGVADASPRPQQPRHPIPSSNLHPFTQAGDSRVDQICDVVGIPWRRCYRRDIRSRTATRIIVIADEAAGTCWR